MQVYLQFPDGFIPFKKYPGYVYEQESGHVYSFKIDGVLKKITRKNIDRNIANFILGKFGKVVKPGLYVDLSHQGKRVRINIEHIEPHLNRTLCQTVKFKGVTNEY